MNKKKWKKEAKYQRERFKARGADLDAKNDELIRVKLDLSDQIGRLERENDRLQEEIAKLRDTVESQAKTIEKDESLAGRGLTPQGVSRIRSEPRY